MLEDGFYRGDMSTFQLPKHFSSMGNTFHERKKERTEFYIKYIYKNKLKQCTACSGYAYYCGHACGSCNGTGKERER